MDEQLEEALEMAFDSAGTFGVAVSLNPNDLAIDGLDHPNRISIRLTFSRAGRFLLRQFEAMHFWRKRRWQWTAEEREQVLEWLSRKFPVSREYLDSIDSADPEFLVAATDEVELYVQTGEEGEVVFTLQPISTNQFI